MLKMFKISASEFGTVEEFLATVTEGVIHGVYKVVIRSSFRLIGDRRQEEVNRCFGTVSQLPIQTSDGSWKD